MNSIRIYKHVNLKKVEIPLASSKSESNRVLIINKLAKGSSKLSNLSTARDTRIMTQLLASDANTLNVKDAGTVMRFMTAFLSLRADGVTITGTERMCLRPIGILVDALIKLGANISYANEHGFPPLIIDKIHKQLVNELDIPGNISSQYISALLMIGPCLPDGLKIKLVGQIYSLPYINMTLKLMSHFGIDYSFTGQEIRLDSQKYISNSYTIESDWSGASYWYSFVALSENAEIKLLGLKRESFQGDQAIVEIMDQLGVDTKYVSDGVLLQKKELLNEVSYDFRNCPDLAQTVMTVAAAKEVSLEMIGLESLKIKETDRIAAMRNELYKIGCSLEEVDEGKWLVSKERQIEDDLIVFETYEDHRMAMALAPLCMRFNIEINDPFVVEKSYPEFWSHLELAGIEIMNN